MNTANPHHALLLEPIHPEATALLATVAELRYVEDRSDDALVKAVADVDGIIIRALGRISARVMDAAPNLKVITRHGTGLDNVDVAAATSRHIYVGNTPEANTESVAEHTLGMMIALSKGLLRADRELRQGNWNFRNMYHGSELHGKTLGLVGFGRIGQRVAAIGHAAFAMPILYYDTQSYPQVEAALGARRCPLDEVLAGADFVSVHVPFLPETQSLIGEREFGLMKPTAYFLNLARGPVMDEAALLHALQEGRIAGAGLDVFVVEPTPKDNPLLTLPNVVVSPHMAAHTEQAMWRMAMGAVQNVMSVFEGHEPPYWVNRW